MQYEGVIAEHGRCGPTPASSTSRTWARSRSKGPTAAEMLQGVLSNDVSRLEEGDAQYTLLTNDERRDRRRPDRLPHRAAPLPARRQRRQPRGRPSTGSRARDPRLGRPRRLRRVRAARRPGARARSSGSASSDGAAVHVGDGRARRDRGDDQPHRVHRRGGRRARLHRPRTRPRSGTRSSRAASRRAASARATRCGSRSATRCTATTSGRSGTRSRAASAGSAPSTRSSPAPSALRDVKARGPGAEARRVPDDRAGDPAAGDDDRRRRRGDLGLALADARRRDRARRTFPPRMSAPGTELTVDVRGRARHGEVATKPIYKREE